MDTTGQSDRKCVNSSPIDGFTMNLHSSIENVGYSVVVSSKSPVMNTRVTESLVQDEWQRKLYKNKGKIYTKLTLL